MLLRASQSKLVQVLLEADGNKTDAVDEEDGKDTTLEVCFGGCSSCAKLCLSTVFPKLCAPTCTAIEQLFNGSIPPTTLDPLAPLQVLSYLGASPAALDLFHRWCERMVSDDGANVDNIVQCLKKLSFSPTAGVRVPDNLPTASNYTRAFLYVYYKARCVNGLIPIASRVGGGGVAELLNVPEKLIALVDYSTDLHLCGGAAGFLASKTSRLLDSSDVDLYTEILDVPLDQNAPVAACGMTRRTLRPSALQAVAILASEGYTCTATSSVLTFSHAIMRKIQIVCMNEIVLQDLLESFDHFAVQVVYKQGVCQATPAALLDICDSMISLNHDHPPAAYRVKRLVDKGFKLSPSVKHYLHHCDPAAHPAAPDVERHELKLTETGHLEFAPTGISVYFNDTSALETYDFTKGVQTFLDGVQPGFASATQGGIKSLYLLDLPTCLCRYRVQRDCVDVWKLSLECEDPPSEEFLRLTREIVRKFSPLPAYLETHIFHDIDVWITPTTKFFYNGAPVSCVPHDIASFATMRFNIKAYPREWVEESVRTDDRYVGAVNVTYSAAIVDMHNNEE